MLEKTDNVKPDAAPHAAPETEPSATPKRGSGGKLLILLALAVLLGGIYFGIRARTTAEAALSQETVEAAVPIVEVVQPKADAPDQALVLPGQTTAFTDTPNLCPRQRLSEEMVCRYRRAGEERRIAGRDRDPRTRRTIAPGRAPIW